MEGLRLTAREEKRLRVMNMVLGGLCGVKEAAELTGLSGPHRTPTLGKQEAGREAHEGLQKGGGPRLGAW